MSAEDKLNGEGETGLEAATARLGVDDEAKPEFTLRALVSTKEAGVIIGKGGSTVADLRARSNVKAGVSKAVPGVQDRILTISGSLEDVSAAYAEVARLLLASPVHDPAFPLPPNAFTSLRLLVSHNLMGSIIGKAGAKIKQIQDASGARMVASKEMLPQSTERVVEVQGAVDAVRAAVAEIGRCLVDDWERAGGTVQYHPGAGGDAGVLAGGIGAQTVSGGTGGVRRTSVGGRGPYADGPGEERRTSGQGAQAGEPAGRGPAGPGFGAAAPGADAHDPNLRSQSISIPSDMVGCIIGRGGAKITEIRRLSGSKISIAKTPHDETGERMFTIVGTPESNEKALFLLYNQLESEKQRRVGVVGEDGLDGN